ncbi:MAG: hypothetical protein AABX01_00240 [Candidatus Micrarchaeota archaeon]
MTSTGAPRVEVEKRIGEILTRDPTTPTADPALSSWYKRALLSRGENGKSFYGYGSWGMYRWEVFRSHPGRSQLAHMDETGLLHRINQLASKLPPGSFRGPNKNTELDPKLAELLDKPEGVDKLLAQLRHGIITEDHVQVVLLRHFYNLSHAAINTLIPPVDAEKRTSAGVLQKYATKALRKTGVI